MSGAMGWKGYLLVGSASSIIPYDSQDIKETDSLVLSEAIHGGGIGTTKGQFHSRINAALGTKIYEGTVSGDVFGGAGAYGNGWDSLVSHAIGASDSSTELREAGFTGTKLIVCPGNSQAWAYPGSGGTGEHRAIVKSLSITGATEASVKYNATIWATSRSASSVTPAVTDYPYETAGDSETDDYNPLPFWKCAVSISGGSLGENVTNRITAWNIAVENNSVRVFTFNGERTAYDIYQGMMMVTGSFTYFGPAGAFAATLGHGATMSVSLIKHTIHLPFLALTERGIPGVGPNDIVTREVNFEGLATSSHASIYKS